MTLRLITRLMCQDHGKLCTIVTNWLATYSSMKTLKGGPIRCKTIESVNGAHSSGTVDSVILTATHAVLKVMGGHWAIFDWTLRHVPWKTRKQNYYTLKVKSEFWCVLESHKKTQLQKFIYDHTHRFNRTPENTRCSLALTLTRCANRNLNKN